MRLLGKIDVWMWGILCLALVVFAAIGCGVPDVAKEPSHEGKKQAEPTTESPASEPGSAPDATPGSDGVVPAPPTRREPPDASRPTDAGTQDQQAPQDQPGQRADHAPVEQGNTPDKGGPTPPGHGERVVWADLKHAQAGQNGRLVLESTLIGDAGFAGRGVGTLGMVISKKGAITYRLSAAKDHHFVGVVIDGVEYAYKVEPTALTPHVDLKKAGTVSFPYKDGDLLVFTLSGQGKLNAHLNGTLLAHDFGVAVTTQIVRPVFRFWPGYVRGFDFTNTFILGGVSGASSLCTAGAAKSCSCPGGQGGTQICDAAGKAWGACTCTPPPTGAIVRVTGQFTLREFLVYQKRAAKQDTHNFHTGGDSGANSPGEWTLIEAYAQHFLKGAATSTTMFKPEYYVWGGPPTSAKMRNDLPWGGVGPVPCLQYRFEYYGDSLMNTAFFSLVKDSSAHRAKVARLLLQQVRVKAVDYANRSLWATGQDQHGCYRHQDSPWFYKGGWLTKILHTYEYAKVRVVGNKVIDSGVFSAADKKEIETWLRNAGDYMRRMADDFYIPRYFGTLANRVAGKPKTSGGLFGKPWKDAKLYDNGPFATEAQLQYNNRIAAVMAGVAKIGHFLHDAKMIQSAKLFYQEFIKYGTSADGTLGDWERSGETGTHYAGVVLGDLVGIADVFARHGDPSLYNYTTSEGATCTVCADKRTTVGGPKGLLMMMKNYAKYFRALSAGGWNRRYAGFRRDGHGQSAAEVGSYVWLLNRYCQHFMVLSQAVVYYRDKDLKDFVYNNKLAGYRGWQPLSKVWGNGYVTPASRGTFATSVGQLFLYGQMGIKSKHIWPFPGATPRSF